jgi:SAM-dependent methyltransferase
VLVERGCTVSGIEYDEAAAAVAEPVMERMVVGDASSIDLLAEFGPQAFDVVVFGDVLEHLPDPVRVLRGVLPVLRPGGSIVVSLPHVAHGDVRLALLQGRWDYRELGLLDRTHLRFFTRANVAAMLRDAGFAAAEVRRTTVDLFGTEIGVKPEDFDQAVIDQVLADPEALTYQFVVRGVVDDADHAIDRLSEREQAARDEIHLLSRQVARLVRENEALIERSEAERERWRSERERADILRSEIREVQRSIELIEATKTMRVLRVPRGLYRRLRSLWRT